MSNASLATCHATRVAKDGGTVPLVFGISRVRSWRRAIQEATAEFVFNRGLRMIPWATGDEAEIMPKIHFEEETLGLIVRNRQGLHIPINQRSYNLEEVAR